MSWLVLNQQLQEDGRKKMFLTEKKKKNILGEQRLSDNSFVGKSYYGILSYYHENYYETFDMIEFVTKSYANLINYLNEKVNYVCYNHKKPFNYKYLIIYKVKDINPRLVSFDFLLRSGYPYFRIFFNKNQFFFLEKKKSNFERKVKESLPELVKFHNISLSIGKIKKKWNVLSLRRYAKKNNIAIDYKHKRSYKKLKKDLINYYLLLVIDQ